MNRFIITLCFLIFSIPVISQSYIPSDKGSKVHFTIKNFGITTGGDLSGLRGNIQFDPLNLSSSEFSVSVQVKTIDTDSEHRDEELKSDSYFNAEKFPEILIKSTKINSTNKTKAGWFFFTGTLTMHGVTKEITFPFSATRQEDDYLFSGNFEINRLDYSVGGPSAIMSKTVKVFLSVLGKKN